MCRCEKCGCDTMEIVGSPFISNWGYGWNKFDTKQLLYFDIKIPYVCTECGFEDFEEVNTTEDDE